MTKTLTQMIAAERQNFHFTPSDSRLEVYDHILARKLNKYFKRFEDGQYMFQPREECFFRVQQNQVVTVELMLKRHLSWKGR
jgi:hypothetical protein